MESPVYRLYGLQHFISSQLSNIFGQYPETNVLVLKIQSLIHKEKQLRHLSPCASFSLDEGFSHPTGGSDAKIHYSVEKMMEPKGRQNFFNGAERG